MPTITYNGNYGLVNATNPRTTNLSATTALPTNAVVTGISFSLYMDSTTYDYDWLWKIYYMRVYNGPSREVALTSHMITRKTTLTGTFPSESLTPELTAVFTSRTISLTTCANVVGDGSSRIAAVSLVVTYELLASISTGELSTSNVLAGETITLTIVNPSLPMVSHTVLWKLGTFEQQNEVAIGIGTLDFQIPLAWIGGIVSSTVGDATVKLTTYESGILKGYQTYNFSISVPSTVIPTITSFVANRINNLTPAGWGIYVQKKSKVNLVATAQGIYGSTIVTYAISGDEYLGSVSNYTTGVINGSGNIVYTVTVTDSRGRIATQTVTILVYAYSPIQLTVDTLERCLANGTSSDTGVYGKIRGIFAVSSCNGNNTVQNCSIYYKNISEDDSHYVAISTAAVSNTTYIFGGALSEVETYTIKVIISDAFAEIIQYLTLPSALFTIFLRSNGKGVSFGKSSTRDEAVEIMDGWSLWIGDSRIMAPVISTTQPTNPVEGMQWLKPIALL